MEQQDLSYLNRDLSKVIILDTHPEHVSAQPENAIIMPKWTGQPGDKGLVAMIPFLECMFVCINVENNADSPHHTAIAIYKPQDVRPILQSYHGKDIPIEYAKKEAEAKQKHIEEWQQSRKNLTSSGFTFSSLFGVSQVRVRPSCLSYKMTNQVMSRRMTLPFRRHTLSRSGRRPNKTTGRSKRTSLLTRQTSIVCSRRRWRRWRSRCRALSGARSVPSLAHHPNLDSSSPVPRPLVSLSLPRRPHRVLKTVQNPPLTRCPARALPLVTLRLGQQLSPVACLLYCSLMLFANTAMICSTRPYSPAPWRRPAPRSPVPRSRDGSCCPRSRRCCRKRCCQRSRTRSGC